jgi:hypothetical protein
MNRQIVERRVHLSSSERLVARAAFAFALAAAIVMSAPSARAEGGTEEAPIIHSARFAYEAPTTVRRWYGYQTVISDFLSTSVFFSGAASFDLCISVFGPDRTCHNEIPAMLILGGMAGYTFGGPVIHAAHGHWDKAGYSLALRVVPIAGAIGIGSALDAGGATPLLVGGAALTGMVLDSALLGYETIAIDAPKVSLAPYYDTKSRTGLLVVIGNI